ncbi:MAG: sodium:proton antiporter [Ignavibacteriaceae bacterium]
MFRCISRIKFFLTVITLFFVNMDLFAIPARIIGKHSLTNDVPYTGVVEHISPSPYIVIPFIILLLMIATGPVFYKRFWDKYYSMISIGMGLIVAVYYISFLNNYSSLLHILSQYISFIALLSSLYTVSGCVLIKIDKKSTPILNVFLLLIGAAASNIIGTTGASMLLIRPYIRINKNRIRAYHIIFFIFLVSNIGGILIPLGPPLFLGFLSGVPFFWVISNLWYIWIFAVSFILIAFYIFDVNNSRHDKSAPVKEYSGRIQIKGYKNFIFLFIIIAAVFIDPAFFPWVPDLSPFPFGPRELIMFAVIYLSYGYADKNILKDNEFDFEPLKEIGYLFFGIFVTMVPALELMASEAHSLGNKISAGIFYWASGILSAALDNTPAYMNFFSAAMGKFGLDINNKTNVLEFVNTGGIYLKAISVASVIFGAATYIGNGPNFIVKSISERAGIEMPGFFAYIIKYSLLILVPVFVLIWLLFFYGGS